MRVAGAPARRHAASVLGVVAALAFVVLVDGAHENGDLSRYDPTVTGEILTLRSSWLTAAAHLATMLGGARRLLLLSLAFGVLLSLRRRSYTPLAAMAAAWSGSVLLTDLMKALVSRHRPSVRLQLGLENSQFSFPSGHTMNATICFGMMALLLGSGASRRRQRALTLGWLALTFAVGASRVYLGYHWLTDVLGGWTLGVTWLCVLLLLHRGLRPQAADQPASRELVSLGRVR